MPPRNIKLIPTSYKAVLEQIQNGTYKSIYLNIRNQYLTQPQINAIFDALNKNQRLRETLKSIDLGNNYLDEDLYDIRIEIIGDFPALETLIVNAAGIRSIFIKNVVSLTSIYARENPQLFAADNPNPISLIGMNSDDIGFVPLELVQQCLILKNLVIQEEDDEANDVPLPILTMLHYRRDQSRLAQDGSTSESNTNISTSSCLPCSLRSFLSLRLR